MPDQITVAVVGLGYVGLPLAVEFARSYPTIGFDISRNRVDDLRHGVDRTLEVEATELSQTALTFTSDPEDLSSADMFVVTVPTPIDGHNRPDLTPLESACRIVGGNMRPGSTVIFESTVYPGATEEVCVPILEAASSLTYNVDFTVGYSPERINPGDKNHRLASIVKVTSGSTPETAQAVDSLYQSIITAGTFPASSIRIAEAAKVIENTQRDVNIALINELAMLFDKLDLDSHEVLQAAGSKWNFLPFRPGLVGGHCIGVDPYYLTHKAQEVGHHPEVILAGRRINDAVGGYIAERLVLLMAQRGIPIGGSRVLIMGLAFKENCPDLRNTKVMDIVRRLETFGVAVDVHDPWVDATEAKESYELDLVNLESPTPVGRYAAAVLAVAHTVFVTRGQQIRDLVGGDAGILFDVKSVLPRHLVDGRL